MEASITVVIDNVPHRIITEFWEDDSFDITILTSERTHNCKISKEHLVASSQKFELDFEVYYDTLKAYLSNADAQQEIQLHLDKGGNFTVYKNKKIKYFYASIPEVNYEQASERLLDSLTTKCSGLEENCRAIKNLIAQDNSEAEEYARQYNKLVEETEEFKDMYIESFNMANNEKKRRICKLMDLLEGDSKCMNSSNDKLQVVSDSDEESTDFKDPATDEEDAVESPSNGQQELNS